MHSGPKSEDYNSTLTDDISEEERCCADLFCVAGGVIGTNSVSTQCIEGGGKARTLSVSYILKDVHQFVSVVIICMKVKFVAMERNAVVIQIKH